MTNLRQLILGLLFFLLSGVTFAADKNPVALTSIHYPPYFGEKMPLGGVMTDLIRAAFKQSDFELNVSFLPFSNAIAKAKEGKEHDGMFTLWYNSERSQWAYFSDPILPNVVGLFKHRDTELPAYWNMKYLKASSKTLGVVKGYENPDEINESGLVKVPAKSDLYNLKALFDKEVDFIVIDKMVADYLIHHYFPGQEDIFVWLDPPLEYRMQYIVITKNAPNAEQKMSAFNHGLKQIRSNGTYDKIMQKHGFDWLIEDQNNWLHYLPN
ncbi:hypothetical protein MED121_23054 [Marinomonas sp. MED121]|uniref:substrate-binding periplasmic protein n=1 Tax=Marinomonas sp. MED121 TaxID=314277 RepID=UPI00006904DC|nr:transporter substrate-binding domain-containing protein [Marinomonas sp. MED121]EAQ64678.1 hypothetical protein MED121_23054 [Marinomonas sp. MED121]